MGGSYSVTLSTCLATTLVHQLRGSAGWDFALPPSGSGWQHFAAASGRDDWAMVINYLLEVTFAKPLKTFRSVIGTPGRGLSAPLFLQSRSPAGKTMFFYTDAGEDSDTAPGPLAWIAGSDEGPEWFPVHNSPLSELGGGNDRGRPGPN